MHQRGTTGVCHARSNVHNYLEKTKGTTQAARDTSATLLGIFLPSGSDVSNLLRWYIEREWFPPATSAGPRALHLKTSDSKTTLRGPRKNFSYSCEGAAVPAPQLILNSCSVFEMAIAIVAGGLPIAVTLAPRLLPSPPAAPRDRDLIDAATTRRKKKASRRLCAPSTGRPALRWPGPW